MDQIEAAIRKIAADPLRKPDPWLQIVGVKTYRPDEFKEKVDWMMERGFLDKEPDYTEVVRGE